MLPVVKNKKLKSNITGG